MQWSWVDAAQIVSAVGTVVAAAISAVAAALSRRSAKAAEGATEHVTKAYVHCRPVVDTVSIDWVTQQADVNNITVELNVSPINVTIANNGLGPARDVWIEVSVDVEDLDPVLVGQREATMGSFMKAYIGKLDENPQGTFGEPGEALILTSVYHKLPPDFWRPIAWRKSLPAPVRFGLGNSDATFELPAEVMSAIAWLSLWKSPFNQDRTLQKLQKSAGPVAKMSLQAKWLGLDGKRVRGETSFYDFRRIEDRTETPLPVGSRGQDWIINTIRTAHEHPSVLEPDNHTTASVPWLELHQKLRLTQIQDFNVTVGARA